MTLGIVCMIWRDRRRSGFALIVCRGERLERKRLSRHVRQQRKTPRILQYGAPSLFHSFGPLVRATYLILIVAVPCVLVTSNESPDFYRDETVFRPPKSKQRPEGRCSEPPSAASGAG